MNNTPIQSYHSQVRPRPARSYRTRRTTRQKAVKAIIPTLMVLGLIAYVCLAHFFVEAVTGPDNPSISYAEQEYFMHPNHEIVPVSRPQEVMFFEASAYTWTGNKTATGTWPEEGRTVAVDSAVIPLGSELVINGIPGYIAEDTGGTIKGRVVDIYMESETACYGWGRRPVKMIVLPREEYIFMYCLICEPLVKLQLEESTERWGWFYNYYKCPQCGTEYECSSQSGDMVQEKLDICE